MKAITTRYIGATDRKPARIIASDLDGNRITRPADGANFPYDDAHRAAAVALCAKLDWPGGERLIGGAVKHGMVWVFPPAAGEAPPAPAPAPGRCGDRQLADDFDPSGPSYRCTLAAGHGGSHVDERHLLHPTWA